MRKIMMCAWMAVVAMPVCAGPDLETLAAAETLHVVRELGVDGQPAIWNGHAV